jgi:DNA-binding MarR family transcriptional regulator
VAAKQPDFDQRIAAVRHFNRFYTKRIGVLEEGLLKSAFSLTEVRVLYELAHHSDLTASMLVKELSLDRGYLSRILQNFEGRGLITKLQSKTDGRQNLLQLTPKGRSTFAPLDARSHDEIAVLLSALSRTEQKRLLTAMRTIEQLLGEEMDK